MAKRGRPRKDGQTDIEGAIDNAKKANVSPEVIAAALAEITDIEVEAASLNGKKAATFKRYENQGVDRVLLKALVQLAKNDQNEARAYMTGLHRYAIATHVLRPADDEWTRSVKQAEMGFAPATGEASERAREAMARKNGYKAGVKGHNLTANPWGALAGSPEFVGWRDGWEQGAETRKALGKGNDKIASTDPKGKRKPPSEPVDADAVARDVADELGGQPPVVH